MAVSLVQIGNKIDLNQIDRNFQIIQPTQKYVSQVLDFKDEGRIKIAVPMYNGRIIPSNIGDRYLMCIYTPKGLYQCKSEVLRRYKEGNLYVLDMLIISSLEKYQRREYFRLECLYQVKYHAITKEEVNIIKMLKQEEFKIPALKAKCEARLEELQNERYDATLIDFSAGGTRFHSSVKHEASDTLIIYIDFLSDHDRQPLQVLGQVITCNPIPGKTGIYESRVGFIKVSSMLRERIVKFVFSEDRKRRKRDKGYD